MKKKSSQRRIKKKIDKKLPFRFLILLVLLLMIPVTILSLQTPKNANEFAQTVPCDTSPTPIDTTTPTDTPIVTTNPTTSPTNNPQPSITGKPKPKKKDKDEKHNVKKKHDKDKQKNGSQLDKDFSFTHVLSQLFQNSQNTSNPATPCISPTPTDTPIPTDTTTPTLNPTTPPTTPIPTTPISANGCVAISVPAYFGTGALWDKVVAASPATRIMIANVNSGPGNSVDPAWTSAINNAKNAGILVLGYVATGHGNNSPASVKAQITQWKQYYNVTSIHLDEAYAPASLIPYYQDLTNFIHANGGISHLGVGDNFDEGFMQAADKFNIFENDINHLTTWSPAGWVKNYSASRFGMDVFGMSASDINTVINTAKNDNIEYITLTDSINPWNELATDTFWNAYVATVKPIACAQ